MKFLITKQGGSSETSGYIRDHKGRFKNISDVSLAYQYRPFSVSVQC
jgi:hypothetical protein